MISFNSTTESTGNSSLHSHRQGKLLLVTVGYSDTFSDPEGVTVAAEECKLCYHLVANLVNPD